MHTAHCLGKPTPPLEVVGCLAEDDRVIAEHAHPGVVVDAHDAAEAGDAAAARIVTVDTSEGVVVVDRIGRAEQLATDGAPAALAGDGGGYLRPAEALALGRRLAWVSGP